jgi:pimeloyl-ACP methyl ester carboxylesterase
LLESLGHKVLTPDLPGHGQNIKNPAKINLKVYSRYIIHLIDSIENKVILVGHSMSGMVISQVAEMRPDKIHRLIYLSAYLPCNGQSLFDLIAANQAALEATPIESAMQISEDKRFYGISPDDIRPLFYNRAQSEHLAAVPLTLPPQPALPLAGKVTLTEECFGKVAKTYICCLDDKVIPISHQRHMMKQQACKEMVQLDTDHSPFLSCPETLAAVLHSASLAD